MTDLAPRTSVASAPAQQKAQLIDVEVVEMTTEAVGVVALTLERVGGGELPHWEAGAHVDLILAPGIERQYSLCGSTDDRHRWQLAILREPASRGGSELVHTQLGIGTRLAIRGPRNHFPLVEKPEYRLIAGGIGITPLLPMVRRLADSSADWQLLYGGRRRESMAFVSQLLELGGDRIHVRPEDEYGLLDLAGFVGAPRPDTAVYCCGPEPLLAAIERSCTSWPADALHVERFGAKPGALDRPALGFEVELAQSGFTVQVADGQSILEALEDAGVDVESSCQEGICGTCETSVLVGQPDHRDSFLTEAERASGEVMMICCSRAAGDRLVLDL